ncbi:MAG: hypothetical protein J2P21_27080 [Chloracidobacterium sp.]|nr:hypothetical protein [Chloracidobacterium sp.]
MVQLDVKVTDHEGRPVSGLTKYDYAVYEDKVIQSIESVSSEEAAVSLGLAIDSSGSMRPKLYTVADAARGLIRLLRPDDEIFLRDSNHQPWLKPALPQAGGKRLDLIRERAITNFRPVFGQNNGGSSFVCADEEIRRVCVTTSLAGAPHCEWRRL